MIWFSGKTIVFKRVAKRSWIGLAFISGGDRDEELFF